ncbi:MAG: DUF1553 domain-containing protein [Pirellulales bacterium]|nr:DUF1553 domain-containing protein [Pirellulales bacterium]
MERSMQTQWRRVVLFLAGCSFGAFATRATAESQLAPVDFNRQIRPIFSDYCFACHGPDETHREGDLRLDQKESAFAKHDGNSLIVPGDSAASELFRRISAKDAEDRMPPPEAEKKLTPEQIELVKRWLEEGAKWQEHWAFVAPVKPEVPQLEGGAEGSGGRVRNVVDAFIVARLQREKLTMSPEADRVTLLRRVTLDLTGLPPTPDEVDAFLKDESSDAYEKVVDRLLSSLRFGEHMARQWLDLARYGDTHGLHLDNEREIWPYRDWVIKAFNENLPYDQFVVDQLGGDLLPNATLDQQVATGFNRCNVTTNEGGSIDEEFYVRYNVDRVDTTGTVFMGLTLGCAVCHDHKYDPITQREFYGLFAFFNSTPERAMDGNAKDPLPVVKLRPPSQQRRLEELNEKLAGLRQAQAQRTTSDDVKVAQAQWLEGPAARPELHQEEPGDLYAYWTFDKLDGDDIKSQCGDRPPGRLMEHPEKVPGKVGDALKFSAASYVELGNCADFDRGAAFSLGAWINVPKKARGAVIAKIDEQSGLRGYDLQIDGGSVAVTLCSTEKELLKVHSKAHVLADQWQHFFVTYDGSGKVAGLKIYINGALSSLQVEEDCLGSSIRNRAPLRIGRLNQGGALIGGAVDEVRIYQRALAAEEVAALTGADPIVKILAVEPEKRTNEQKTALQTYYLKHYDEPYRQFSEEIAPLEEEQQEIERIPVPLSLVMQELPQPRDAFVLERGEYDKRGEKVERLVPAVLPPLPIGAPVNRLGLAEWLVHANHPLTTRVEVNRFWQQLFGIGLVPTSENFGSQGEPPTYPKLLDWLAVDFRESGWDVKRMLKMLVMSATYRQSSRVTPVLHTRDPQNTLLARGPRFRLDAEAVRDQALFVSGLLVEQIGGPCVRPYQPPGLWEAVAFTSSNTGHYVQDKGDALYRRTMYTFWKRTSPPPTLTLLDAPSRENCTPRRSRTNTPTQALALMNDVQFVEAARHLAARGMKDVGMEPKARAAHMFRLATGRLPKDEELAVMVSSYEKHLAVYKADGPAAKKLLAVGDSKRDESLDAAEHAAWTMVGSLILNLDEVLTKG